MFKNVASQRFDYFAFDYSTGAPKTGDAANHTIYVAKDDGSLTALTDTSSTELSSTNAPGWYHVDVSQTETNADKLQFSGKSSTGNVVVVPRVIYTRPATGLLAPTTAGRTLDVSAGGEAGIDWANVGSPTTTLALTGTTIATTQKVDVETIKTNPVVNAGTVTFPTGATLASTTNITAGTIATVTNVTTVNGLAANVITATSIASDAITAAKIANNAIDAATFAADVDAEFLSYLVDDATRIDASALNTLSGHDPGETIMGATDLGTGSGLTTLATQASVNTIDGIVDDILLDTAEIGTAGAGLTNINLPNQTMDIVGNITGSLSGSVGSVSGTIGGLTAAALKDFFDTDSTTTYASAVSGSVVKEIADNASGGGGGSFDPTDTVPASPSSGTYDKAFRQVLDNLDAPISGVGGATGSGADEVTITITVSAVPVADADVWVTSDAGGSAVVAGTLQTNGAGQVTFLLDDGVSYYLWAAKDGYNLPQGELFVANDD